VPSQRRTVVPDAEKIRLLRTRKGWTQDDLANHSRNSRKTVENLEAGKPTFLRTLSQIAQTLGVQPSDLMLSKDRLPFRRAGTVSVSTGQAESKEVSEDKAALEIVIGRDFESYTEEEQERLLAAIRDLLSVGSDVRIISKRRSPSQGQGRTSR